MSVVINWGDLGVLDRRSLMGGGRLRQVVSHRGYLFIYLFIVLFAKNCTNQIKSNYLNSHGAEA